MLLPVTSRGASEPEIVRMDVPAGEVAKLFPAGTELRVMPVEQFDSLVQRAVEGSVRLRAAQSPRLIRARHQARWDSGILSGRTELVVEASSSGPADFVLEPWTPAILPTARAHKVLGARDSGKPSLWIDQTPNQTIVLEWELRPRWQSGGRRFALALPAEEMTVLALEIPKEWVAVCRRGRRRPPMASGDGTRNQWEIEAESGQIDLQLYKPDQGESLVGTSPWLSGSTQIDLRRSTDPGRALANWTTDWQVEFDPRNPKRLDIELDPGLELIDVQGSAVRGYRSERVGSATRLGITLDGDLKSSTALRFLAHARVPSEGAWTIPAIRPLSATWTGGTTTVILDEFHVLQECREKAGQRIFAGPADSTAANQLVFESKSSRSVADLVLRIPRAESSCEVRGQLLAGVSPCRLECQLHWRFQHGSNSELAIDLSRTWLPDRVSIRGLEDPVAWHPSVLASGITRLHVTLPAARPTQTELVLEMSAISTVPGSRGPIELPRVRPAGTRLVDEAWVAWVDKNTMIQPTLARGLAWIDPAEVPGLLTPRAAGSDLREALAWRWTDELAQARVDRQRIEQESSAAVRALAQVDPIRGLLTLDGNLHVTAGAASLDSIPIWVNQPDDSLKSLSFRDQADDSELAPVPLDEAARARLGFSREGCARSLPVKVASQTEKTIHFHGEFPWSSRGSIPLVAVAQNYLFRGTILVETPAGTRARLKNVGLTRLDPSVDDQPPLEPDPDVAGLLREDRSSPKRTIAHAFSYSRAAGQLELATEPLAPLHTAGIIRDALLVTVVDPKGTRLNRLRLLVQPGEAHSLELVPPSNFSLVRVRRDGSDVPPIRSRTGLSIPLPGSSQGPRSSTVVIDYVISAGPIADGGRLVPKLPEVNLPCLSFDWEVVTSGAWKAADCGPGWIANDRDNAWDWPNAALGLWRPAWDLIRDKSRAEDPELLRVLDRQLVDAASAELTFAEWFSRWDAGPLPVVIDRVSLNSAGLGPKSQCVPSRVKAERRNISLATLDQYGLAMVPYSNALLITTVVDSPKFDQRERWNEAISESLVWGSDRTDRFQTLAHWRGEPSGASAATSGDEAAERSKLPHGWSTWRFAGPRWPARDSFVYLIDVNARIVKGWIIAASSLVVWFWSRRLLARRRFQVCSALMAGALLLEWMLPSRYASFTAALFVAAFVILIIELGHRVAQASTALRSGGHSASSRLRHLAASALGLVVAGVLWGGIASGQPAVQSERGSAILVLFPYEGSFDPTRPARDVILRLADFVRLSRLAEGAGAPPFGSVRAVSALHRVARNGPRDIVIDSEFELVAFGAPPFAWRIPIASARNIEATLDGKWLPIAIEPGAMMGSVTIPGAGSHRLRIHRSVAARTEAAFERLSLPVNALPSARVVVESPRDGLEQGEVNAAGGTELQADGSLAGGLGPADRIEVRWPKPNPAAAARAGGTVEGLILWDIHPAGDRVRWRFTFHQSHELSTIRFAHPSGLILRSGKPDAAVDAIWDENAGQDEWTLHVDPPLQPGSTIELDCWMPANVTPEDRGKPPAESGVAGGALRRLPRLQPIGVERYSGSVGVRRPGHWTARFDPIPDTEPISDEFFARSWGGLPAEPLTFCGTSRFVRDSRASLVTAPAPARVLVKPSAQLQLESGRIAMTVEAELSELSGHLWQVEARIPDGLQIVEVTADGLTDWTTTADHGLRLMFDRPVARPRRLLRVLGWIPLAEDPLKTGARHHRIQIPWIDWQGMDEAAGSLTITSISKPELGRSPGLTVISDESPGAVGTARPRHRLTCRVDDPEKLGELLWESIPARVNVSIESQITIRPDSAEWVAALRYDVVGGALDVIHLKMPAAWAAGAELRLAGGRYQLITETRGPAAFWTITPERPIWGSQRFVLRSTRTLGADREIVYPEISPLGRGSASAYLGVVSATGRPPAIESSGGLEKIAYAARFQARDFAMTAGTPVGAFRVAREPWSLLVRLPRDLAEANRTEDGSARIAFGDMTVVALPDRSSIGRVVYETVAGSGSQLSFELPAGSTPLWAAVDSTSATPLRSSAGSWSVAVDDRRQSRVSLIWKTEAVAATSPGSTWPVVVPRAGTGPATTLLAVYAPPQFAIGALVAGLVRTTKARVELARADWLGRSIIDFVAKLDRSSGRDHEKLVSLLINQEMALRSAERSSRGTDPAATRSESDGPERNSERIRETRAARVEITRRAGLESDLVSAQSYLGTSPVDVTRPLVGVPEAAIPDRVRLFGRPSSLIGLVPGVDGPSATRTSLILESRPWLERGGLPPMPAIITLFLLAAIGLIASGTGRGFWSTALALLVALGLAGSLGGPASLTGGLVLAAVGWKKARGQVGRAASQ
jgi:hypothetical protein